MPAISAPKKPAPKLLPTQAPMAQGPARRGQKWSSRCRRRERAPSASARRRRYQKSFFRLGSVAASGTAPLPYNMTETASRIPPETTKGSCARRRSSDAGGYFLVFAPVRSLLAPERCRARDSIDASTLEKGGVLNSREKVHLLDICKVRKELRSTSNLSDDRRDER